MKLSIVTTLYHSAPFIEEFYARMKSEADRITSDYEFIFVNDGSPDNSKQKILDLLEQDPHIVLIDLSRNFGHHKAMLTGLRHAQGEQVFLIDSDLEEDPALLSVFRNVLMQQKDIDVVYGIQKKRKGNWFEKISGDLYYSFFSFLSKNKYPRNTLTARLMTQQYIEGLRNFNEKESDLWGIFILNGFNQKAVPVDKGNKGRTTYTFRRKLTVAIETMTTLTHRPLYLILATGLVITSGALVYGLILLCRYWVKDGFPAGSLLLASIWFLGGLIILSLGVISVYLGKMFLEVKDRPISIIKHIYRKLNSGNEGN